MCIHNTTVPTTVEIDRQIYKCMHIQFSTHMCRYTYIDYLYLCYVEQSHRNIDSVVLPHLTPSIISYPEILYYHSQYTTQCTTHTTATPKFHNTLTTHKTHPNPASFKNASSYCGSGGQTKNSTWVGYILEVLFF